MKLIVSVLVVGLVVLFPVTAQASVADDHPAGVHQTGGGIDLPDVPHLPIPNTPCIDCW